MSAIVSSFQGASLHQHQTLQLAGAYAKREQLVLMCSVTAATADVQDRNVR